VPELLDLGMSDEEYLELIAQGRNPVQEQIRQRNLIRAGVSLKEAPQLVLFLEQSSGSTEQDALFKGVWKRVLY
jgi:hypothetical protein